MRQFNEQPSDRVLFNFGHLVFLGLLNVLYGQRLRDPFSMFKVFRRDCLYGLSSSATGSTSTSSWSSS